MFHIILFCFCSELYPSQYPSWPWWHLEEDLYMVKTYNKRIYAISVNTNTKYITDKNINWQESGTFIL